MFEILAEVGGSLTPSQFEYIERLISVGEPGVAIEDLCIFIEEDELPISRQLHLNIQKACGAMSISIAYYSELEKYVVPKKS